MNFKRKRYVIKWRNWGFFTLFLAFSLRKKNVPKGIEKRLCRDKSRPLNLRYWRHYVYRGIKWLLKIKGWKGCFNLWKTHRILYSKPFDQSKIKSLLSIILSRFHWLKKGCFNTRLHAKECLTGLRSLCSSRGERQWTQTMNRNTLVLGETLSKSFVFINWRFIIIVFLDKEVV